MSVNPECLVVAMLTMPAVSRISAHSPGVFKWKLKKKDLSSTLVENAIKTVAKLC